MSFATRCTACGTVFRIVEDQLRVSDGWVRCGRCAEIFDARELLFDIEREAPPPWPPAFTPAAVVEPPPPAPLPPPPPPPPPPPAPAEPVWMPPPEPEPQADALPTGWPDGNTRQEPRWVDVPDATATAPAPRAPANAPEPSPVVAEPSSAAVVPEFMRHAQTTAKWKRPSVRIALAGLSLLLILVLGLQMALQFRDAIAAQHPPLRGALQVLCGTFSCEVRPWRHIEALSIESTSLNPVGTTAYKLNLLLRNKSAVEVAAPSIELSLTDASGAPFARRVIGPEALTPAMRVVGPESEQPLSFSFSTNGQHVSGYSVNIFYP
ncbi:zinc-ribbon and DUF3426 domain-containing protein [Pelomonas cellulosilytica]|uniref:Zinc-ribbon domain-containing protein n=1 Tax=Pelomonas cellulosilytica TaxID=2906762 RepID=A0ABS8XNX9_9BURK|nr:zinc-ribbon and DUF3426 domain-containing protein [Pelomonas sp. P8]MCE4553000.1 zinc-ribbon domain-containing protein [Pelomonas sp. P8]